MGHLDFNMGTSSIFLYWVFLYHKVQASFFTEHVYKVSTSEMTLQCLLQLEPAMFMSIHYWVSAIQEQDFLRPFAGGEAR